LSAATGGSNGEISIGGTFFPSDATGEQSTACAKVIDSALTAEQVYAEYERTWALAPLTALTDTTVSGVIGKKLGLEHSPLGLWNFEENMLDDSGNDFDFTVSAGTERYTSIRGMMGFRFDAATRLHHNVTGTSLEILGDVTMHLILCSNAFSGTQRYFHYTGGGETEANNGLYGNGNISGQQLTSLSEKDGGTNIEYTVSSAALNVGELILFTTVRENNQITYYLDGVQVGDTSSGLDAPTGGTTSVLTLGNATANGTIVSAKIIDSALTTAQVYEEFRSLWADAPSSVGGGGSSVDETQVALLSQVFGS
jgi:hypothetical protein